jgi:hypothetical protein
MNKRLRSLLRQSTFNLRGGFLVRPLTIALALGLAGALLSWLEEASRRSATLPPGCSFPRTPIHKLCNSFWAASRRPS